MVKVTSEVEGDDHVLCASQRLMVRHVLYEKSSKETFKTFTAFNKQQTLRQTNNVIFCSANNMF